MTSGTVGPAQPVTDADRFGQLGPSGVRIVGASEAQAFARSVAASLPSGATVMVGGFGEPGTPFLWLEALADAGPERLTIVKNDANEAGIGVGKLLRAGKIARLVSTHIGLNAEAVAAWRDGSIQVEIHPQGLLAERIRCAAAGLPAFLSDLDPELLPETDPPRQRLRFHGREVTIEPALHADLALVRAHRADPFGNLRFRATARNFGPAMALAAKRVLVEAERTESEPIPPDDVHVPGARVAAVVQVPDRFDPGSKAERIRRGEAP